MNASKFDQLSGDVPIGGTMRKRQRTSAPTHVLEINLSQVIDRRNEHTRKSIRMLIDPAKKKLLSACRITNHHVTLLIAIEPNAMWFNVCLAVKQSCNRIRRK